MTRGVSEEISDKDTKKLRKIFGIYKYKGKHNGFDFFEKKGSKNTLYLYKCTDGDWCISKKLRDENVIVHTKGKNWEQCPVEGNFWYRFDSEIDEWIRWDKMSAVPSQLFTCPDGKFLNIKIFIT